MRRTIETVPIDGKVVILEDDNSETFELAHWSAQDGAWVGRNGQACKIAPTYWHDMPRAEQLIQQDYNFRGASNSTQPVFPIPPNATVPDAPSTAPEVVFTPRRIPRSGRTSLTEADVQTAAEKAGRTALAGRRFAGAAIGAAMISASFFGMYFRGEVATYVHQHAAVDQLRSRIDVEQVDKKITSSAYEAPPAEQVNAGAGSSGAASTQLAVTLEAITTKQLADLQLELAAAKQELITREVQNREELAAAREQAAWLDVELAKARHDFQALSGSTTEDAAQIRRAVETAEVELRQSLQRERDRVETVTSELETLRRSEVDQASKTREATAQSRRAVETTTAELQQSFQQEQDNRLALERQLARARQDLETQTAQLSKARDEIALLDKTARTAVADLQQERDKNQQLAGEIVTVRRDLGSHEVLLKKMGDEIAGSKQRELARTLLPPVDHKVEGSLDAKSTFSALALSLSGRNNDRVADRLPGNQTSKEGKTAGTAGAEQLTQREGGQEAFRLLERANAFLLQGNIGAARGLLERAAEIGNAQATFRLAETYDPFILSTWRTYGTRGDAKKALELYATAFKGGIKAAKDRSLVLLRGFDGSDSVGTAKNEFEVDKTAHR